MASVVVLLDIEFEFRDMQLGFRLGSRTEAQLQPGRKAHSDAEKHFMVNIM